MKTMPYRPAKFACCSIVALFGALMAVGPTEARAQSPLENLLGAVLQGQQGDMDRDTAERAARACENEAEDRQLDVERVLSARQSGANNIELEMRVDDRGDEYTLICTYDRGDDRVEDLERSDGFGGWADRGSGNDQEVGDRLADDARDACEDLVSDRRLDDVDVRDVRSRGREMVEVRIEARDRGDDRVRLTCLYDTDRRQAFLGD
jgi:hypothetical protein